MARNKNLPTLMCALALVAVVGQLLAPPSATTKVLNFTFGQECRHGTCGHWVPVLKVELDGRGEQPLLVVHSLVSGEPELVFTEEVDRVDFEKKVIQADKLGEEHADIVFLTIPSVKQAWLEYGLRGREWACSDGTSRR